MECEECLYLDTVSGRCSLKGDCAYLNDRDCDDGTDAEGSCQYDSE